MIQHCPDVKELKSLIMSQTSCEYETKKHSIIVNNANLEKYLDKNNKWEKISRFETDVPICHILNLKNKEPLEIFQQIYDIGFFVIKNLCNQDEMLTDCARDYLSYAFTVAQHLTVFQSLNLNMKRVKIMILIQK